MANQTVFEAGEIERMLDRTAINVKIPEGMVGVLVEKPSKDMDQVTQYRRLGYEILNTEPGDLQDPSQILMVMSKERHDAISAEYVRRARMIEAPKSENPIEGKVHGDVSLSQNEMIRTAPVSIQELGQGLPDESEIESAELDKIAERLANTASVPDS